MMGRLDFRFLLIGIAMLPAIARAADSPGTATSPAGAPPGNSAIGANAGGIAATDISAPQARIPFANRGGIDNWRVVDDRTVLIQGLNRQWYKATLMSPCIDLPFAQRIWIQIEPGRQLRQVQRNHRAPPTLSADLVDQDRCPCEAFQAVGRRRETSRNFSASRVFPAGRAFASPRAVTGAAVTVATAPAAREDVRKQRQSRRRVYFAPRFRELRRTIRMIMPGSLLPSCSKALRTGDTA
jgi:hypothetical protein